MIAFDADVLIYAASETHPLGARIAKLFTPMPDEGHSGSVLLIPELLSKPLRQDPNSSEAHALEGLLGNLVLYPLDGATARLAANLGAKYKLQAADATHLATAIANGADQFLTNNRRDFPQSITEIDIIYPTDLPEPVAF